MAAGKGIDRARAQAEGGTGSAAQRHRARAAARRLPEGVGASIRARSAARETD